jgi:flagellar biosynthesis protein FliR
MTEILIGEFISVFLIFVRIISMIMVLPVLGHEAIPNIAKIFLAFILAYITFLTINKTHIVIDVNVVSITLSVFKEILTGLIMGYILNFVFYGISYAGSLIGFEMGLTYSDVLNPMQDSHDNSIGQPIYYAAVMIFLVLNGHHHVISAVVASFNVIPIAKFTATEPVIQLITKYSALVFIVAFKISSPIIVSFLLVHIAEGIISRVVSNIQIFFISQPAKIALGFAFLAALAPIFVFAIKALLNDYENQLQEIIKTMSV